MIKAVIFDVDGTLVDSNELHVDAWAQTFRHFGKEFPREQLKRQIGKGADQYLPAFLDEEELRTVGKKIEEYRGNVFKERYLPHVKPFPKVRELIERVRADGKQVVLATSGTAAELETHKKLAHIADLIDAAISADDAEESKPSPDIFAAALQKLDGLSAREVVVVGDTPYDAEAAAKLRIGTIGLLCGGFREEELRGAGAIAIYRDPADLLEKYDSSPLAADDSRSATDSLATAQPPAHQHS
jgi:HAD superfamily hydrolase (TIGR01549 family)